MTDRPTDQQQRELHHPRHVFGFSVAGWLLLTHRLNNEVVCLLECVSTQTGWQADWWLFD